MNEIETKFMIELGEKAVKNGYDLNKIIQEIHEGSSDIYNSMVYCAFMIGVCNMQIEMGNDPEFKPQQIRPIRRRKMWQDMVWEDPWEWKPTTRVQILPAECKKPTKKVTKFMLFDRKPKNKRMKKEKVVYLRKRRKNIGRINQSCKGH